MSFPRSVLILLSLLVVLPGCGREPPAETPASPDPDGGEAVRTPPPLPEVEVPDELAPVLEPWHGDLDGMQARRRIRVGVVHGSFFLYFENGRPRGLTYELLRQFEQVLNKRLGLKRAADQVHLVIVPVRRDHLFSWLEEGRIDIAASNLTVTPGRAARVDFSVPLSADIREIVVSGPAAPAVSSLTDLAGRSVLVRVSSSYHDSLLALNERLTGQGLSPVEIIPAFEVLEDEDILALVSAGLADATIVDEHKAGLLAAGLPDLTVHADLAVREGGEIAWAFRKNSPLLAAEVNHFAEGHRVGTLVGNVLVNRYLGERTRVDGALTEEGRQLLSEEADLFRKWGEEYGFHWLMLAAQGFQESGLDQSRRSRSGAVGIMQIKPSTARDKHVGVKDVTTMDGNIQAGAKYMRFLADRYFSAEGTDPMNQWLLALAAYNAGPSRLINLRNEAEKSGLDPDVWFDNVELIAAQRIGRETVTYVRNVVSYYLAYRLAYERAQIREEARGLLGTESGEAES